MFALELQNAHCARAQVFSSLPKDAQMVEQHHRGGAHRGLQLEDGVQALLLRLDQLVLRHRHDELDRGVGGVLLEVSVGKGRGHSVIGTR